MNYSQWTHVEHLWYMAWLYFQRFQTSCEYYHKHTHECNYASDARAVTSNAEKNHFSNKRLSKSQLGSVWRNNNKHHSLSGLLTSSKHFHFMVVNDTTNRPVDLWNNTSIIGSRSGSKISCPNMVYTKILDHSFIHQMSQSVVLLIAPYTRFNLKLPPINHKTIIKVVLNAHFILVYELYRRSCPKLVRNFQKEVAVHKKINNFVSCATDSLIMSHC